MVTPSHLIDQFVFSLTHIRSTIDAIVNTPSMQFSSPLSYLSRFYHHILQPNKPHPSTTTTSFYYRNTYYIIINTNNKKPFKSQNIIFSFLLIFYLHTPTSKLSPLLMYNHTFVFIFRTVNYILLYSNSHIFTINSSVLHTLVISRPIPHVSHSILPRPRLTHLCH